MVCVNSVFSRKDNCEKFAHAFAAYIGLEVEKWFGIINLPKQNRKRIQKGTNFNPGWQFV